MLLILVLFSYLIGSIPSGYIFVKKILNKDIRNYGSGNIGATNVKRVAGKKLSNIVLLCDMLKAIIPVLLTKVLIANNIINVNENLSLGLVAIAAIVALSVLGKNVKNMFNTVNHALNSADTAGVANLS